MAADSVEKVARSIVLAKLNIANVSSVVAAKACRLRSGYRWIGWKSTLGAVGAGLVGGTRGAVGVGCIGDTLGAGGVGLVGYVVGAGCAGLVGDTLGDVASVVGLVGMCASFVFGLVVAVGIGARRLSWNMLARSCRAVVSSVVMLLYGVSGCGFCSACMSMSAARRALSLDEDPGTLEYCGKNSTVSHVRVPLVEVT